MPYLHTIDFTCDLFNGFLFAVKFFEPNDSVFKRISAQLYLTEFLSLCTLCETVVSGLICVLF